MPFCANDGQSSCFFHAWSKLDIRTTTGHIGSDRYSPATSCLRYNLRLTLMIFRIQNIVRNTLQIECIVTELRATGTTIRDEDLVQF